jgi:hypothetical protein
MFVARSRRSVLASRPVKQCGNLLSDVNAPAQDNPKAQSAPLQHGCRDLGGARAANGVVWISKHKLSTI